MNLKPLRSRLSVWRFGALVRRAVILSAGWWILSEGDASAAGFGALCVLLAFAVSLWLPASPAPTYNVIGCVRYGLTFLEGSVVGGVDVARRALTPGRSLSPALIRYPLGLAEGAGRQLFMATLSLMPGTLSADLEHDMLVVHVLVDERQSVLAQLRTLEARVASALGERLEPRDA